MKWELEIQLKVGEFADNAYWGKDSISNDEINKKINEQKVN